MGRRPHVERSPRRNGRLSRKGRRAGTFVKLVGDLALLARSTTAGRMKRKSRKIAAPPIITRKATATSNGSIAA